MGEKDRSMLPLTPTDSPHGASIASKEDRCPVESQRRQLTSNGGNEATSPWSPSGQSVFSLCHYSLEVGLAYRCSDIGYKGAKR